MGQFVYVIRKRIKLAPEKAIFIFVDEVLPPTAQLMSAIYEEHKYVLLLPDFRGLAMTNVLVIGTKTVSCTLATLERTLSGHGDRIYSFRASSRLVFRTYSSRIHHNHVRREEGSSIGGPEMGLRHIEPV